MGFTGWGWGRWDAKCTWVKEVVLLVHPKSCSELHKEPLVWRDILGIRGMKTGQTDVSLGIQRQEQVEGGRTGEHAESQQLSQVLASTRASRLVEGLPLTSQD